MNWLANITFLVNAVSQDFKTLAQNRVTTIGQNFAPELL